MDLFIDKWNFSMPTFSLHFSIIAKQWIQQADDAYNLLYLTADVTLSYTTEPRLADYHIVRTYVSSGD